VQALALFAMRNEFVDKVGPNDELFYALFAVLLFVGGLTTDLARIGKCGVTQVATQVGMALDGVQVTDYFVN
jgi:hypothetical protein